MKGKRILHKYKYLFIDGYNYLNSIGGFDGKVAGALEEGRRALVETLVEYQAYSGERIFLVFDAYTIKSFKAKIEKHNQIEVVFTKEFQTADSYIEIEVEKVAKDPKNLVRVVTSDWAEQQIVLGSGAIRISPREFSWELDKMKEHIKKDYIEVTKQKNQIEESLPTKVLEALEKWRKANS